MTANKVSAPIAANVHQVQVLPTTDFKLMTFLLRLEIPFRYSQPRTLASIWGAIQSGNYLLTLIEFRE